MCQVVRECCELMKQPPSDTFLGPKTLEGLARRRCRTATRDDQRATINVRRNAGASAQALSAR
jgi:hypothetical protein